VPRSLLRAVLLLGSAPCATSDKRAYVNQAGVRFVDQKPALNKVWGIGPERKSSEAREFENLLPVSV
jgi:hypothetical protein